MKVFIGRLVPLCIMLLASLSSAKVLDTLIIEGVSSSVQGSIVRSQCGLHTKSDISGPALTDAVKRLYYLGLFKSVDFAIASETDTSVSLVLKVLEFPMVETVEYVGNKKLKIEDFEKTVTLKKNQVLSDASQFNAITAIKKLYAEKGYLNAAVTIDTVSAKALGNVLVKIKIKENAKVEVKTIAFKGNVAIKTSKLKWTFKTKEKKILWGGDFDAEKYKLHLDSLIMFYNDLGYLDAEIEKDSVNYSDNKKDLNLVIYIHEGNKFIRGNVYFTGNKVIETPDLDSVIAFRKGKPFSKTEFEMTKEAVVSRYREDGFLWVQVKDQRQYRGDTIDVTFDIVEGVPAIIRKIDITGNTKTREKVVRRELVLYPGQKYKHSQMMRSVRDAMQLNFFTTVVPDMRPNDDGTVDFIFNIQEKDNIGQLQLGAAYSVVDKFTANFSTSIPNFRGAGQQLNLSVDYGMRRQAVSLGFMEPWAFETPTSLSGTVFFDRGVDYTNADISVISGGFRGGVGRRLTWPDDYFTASAGYELSWQDQLTSNSATNLLDYEYKNGNLEVLRRGLYSKLSLGLRRSDTDLPMFPTSGSVLSINTDIAGLGGDYSFAKGILSTENYYPIFWKVVLIAQTKFGLISSLGAGPIKIPRGELFKAGGVYGVDGIIRGYPEYSFGGYSNTFYSQGTNRALTMLTLSGGLQIPILDQQLYLMLFGDMGNIWARIADVNLKDTYHGVGAGFRLQIPMLGLLGFDFGWGLDQLDKDSYFGNKPQSHLVPHFIMNKGF